MAKEKHSHWGHRQRLREKMIKNGLESLADHEALEILLGFCIAQRDLNDTAHALIDEFGSIKAVFDAPYEELLKISGVGEVTASYIKFVPEITKFYYTLGNRNTKNIYDDLSKIGALFLPKFIGESVECVYAAAFDNVGRLIKCEKVATGIVNLSQVTIKQIVDFTIRSNAASIALAHNHPSGIALPSVNDYESTKTIESILKTVGVALIDHIIVTDDDYVSLRESGVFR